MTILCGRQRASEIVGDLLEQQNDGPASFWWMFLRVVFAMSWRWPVAIITAAMSILFALVRYVAFFQSTQSLPRGTIRLSWGVDCMLVKCLHGPVLHRGDAQRTEFTVRLRDVDTPQWKRTIPSTAQRTD